MKAELEEARLEKLKAEEELAKLKAELVNSVNKTVVQEKIN